MHQIVFCLPETKEIIESIQSGELKNVNNEDKRIQCKHIEITFLEI